MLCYSVATTQSSILPQKYTYSGTSSYLKSSYLNFQFTECYKNDGSVKSVLLELLVKVSLKFYCFQKCLISLFKVILQTTSQLCT